MTAETHDPPTPTRLESAVIGLQEAVDAKQKSGAGIDAEAERLDALICLAARRLFTVYVDTASWNPGNVSLHKDALLREMAKSCNAIASSNYDGAREYLESVQRKVDILRKIDTVDDAASVMRDLLITEEKRNSNVS